MNGVHWPLVPAQAEEHQVAPFVHEALGDPGEVRIPEDVRANLLLQFHHTGLRNEVIRNRLGAILQEAAGAGMEVMLLKGAVLAYRAYARLEHRVLGDVDLLLRERDFGKLREVLSGFGYRCSVPNLRSHELPRYAHCVRQVRFEARCPPPIEVHFRLFNYGMPGKSEPAWDDATPLDFFGAPVWTPSPERFLLHLCLHAQQHGFAILRLLVDIAVWWRCCRIDADRFVNLARRHHLATAAYYALTYTSNLLQLPELQELCERLRPPRWKGYLFERIWHDQEVRALEARMSPREAELPKAFLLGEAPWSAKFAFLWNVAFPPQAWIAPRNGRDGRLRWDHATRILSAARQSLLGSRARGR